MTRNSFKKQSKPSYLSKPMPEKKVDAGFYGAKDLTPKLTKKINSTGGY